MVKEPFSDFEIRWSKPEKTWPVWGQSQAFTAARLIWILAGYIMSESMFSYELTLLYIYKIVIDLSFIITSLRFCCGFFFHQTHNTDVVTVLFQHCYIIGVETILLHELGRREKELSVFAIIIIQTGIMRNLVRSTLALCWKIPLVLIIAYMYMNSKGLGETAQNDGQAHPSLGSCIYILARFLDGAYKCFAQLPRCV